MVRLRGSGEVEPPGPLPAPDGVERAGATVMVANVDTEDVVDEGGARMKWLANGLKRRDWNRGFGWAGSSGASFGASRYAGP